MMFIKSISISLILLGFVYALAATDDVESNAEKIRKQALAIQRLEALIETQSQQVQALVAQVNSLKNAGKLEYTRNESGKIVIPGKKKESAEKQDFSSKYGVRFYGYIKADAIYQDAHTSAGNLAHYVYPETESTGDEFFLTANQTRLGFDIGSLTDEGATAKIEMDFYGSNSPENKAKLRMRKAYVKWNSGKWSFLAGQDSDTILQAIPTSVNFNYYHLRGKLGYRSPQLRAARSIDMGGGITFTPTVAVGRMVGGDFDSDGQDDGADAGFPTIQWAAPITGDFFGTGKAKFALAGHWGTERIDQPAHYVDGNLETWSLGASWMIPITSKVLWKGTAWTGANLDFYLGGIGQGVNSIKGDVVEAKGGWTQIRVKINPKLDWGVGMGIDDPDNDDLWEGARASNSHVDTSVFYTLEQGVQLGLEYQRIRTEYVGKGAFFANRFQGTVIYKF